MISLSELMVAERLKKHTISFQCAFKGIGYAIKTQPNFGAHILLAVTTVGLGLFMQISRIEWLILALTVSSVLTAEMFNTAVEVVTDAFKAHKKTEQDDFYIMVAKDMAAGAVLLSALGSIVVGLIIFGPRIWAR